MTRKRRSLKDLLLIHELAFIILILLVAAVGAFGIHLQEKSSQESARISLLVQEVQQTRGDLYRQMKELFDAYFLDDLTAHSEYNVFTQSVEKHFSRLESIASDKSEKTAINNLHKSYRQFLKETSELFDQKQGISSDKLKRRLNAELESGLFIRYEALLARTEQLLSQKQIELDNKLKSHKQKSTLLLFIPLVLAIMLLVFSRIFLNRSIVKPIKGVLDATAEISAGQLTHRAPEADTEELAALSKAINEMAEKLSASQDALVRTEKQAAQGLLVPMLAHNIRNPLASIRATAQIMDSPENDDETKESLIGIINTVDRLERWTGALLAYLHPLKPQATQTTIKSIVEGALEPLRQKIIQKSIVVSTPTWTRDDANESGAIFTDQHLLEQVIYNLLLNAIDASSKESSIEVQLEIDENEFTLQLLDRGCGMPFKPDPSSINAPTSKRFGTGLGIPFAFKVCDALGGELSFSARPGGGSIITIILPKTFNVT